MDVSNLLSREPIAAPNNGRADAGSLRQGHTYPTRYTNGSQGVGGYGTYSADSGSRMSYTPHNAVPPNTVRHAPREPPKTVNFQLLLSEAPHHRARLPLRVHINPHDNTESIITTVKNFYGLYEGEGVSFEDDNSITLIAQYENLIHNTTIYVRVMPEQPGVAETQCGRVNGAVSPQKPRLDEAFQMLPPQPCSRPNSRSAKKRSMSPPSGRGHRGVSVLAPTKPKVKTGGYDDDAAAGISDSDAGSVSVSSSRRAKSDQLASADISLDNIVEGGRRKRAKFESSELPLFAPPQQPMTASMSSLSPQRRLNNTNVHSPLPYSSTQHTFAYNYQLPSPQSYGHGDNTTISTISGGLDNVTAPSRGHRLRGRASSGHGPSRLSGGSISGLLPTPDPTIGSVISDEDVALQLMRLGDASNISNGRTSTSTVDDALSGKAELASSDEETEEETEEESLDEDDLPIPVQTHVRTNHNHISGPTRKKHRIDNPALLGFDSGDTSIDDYDDHNDGSFKGESDGIGPNAFIVTADRAAGNAKSVKSRSSSTTGKGHHKSRHSSISKTKPRSFSSGKIPPPTPYGAPPSIRKGSSTSTLNLHQQLAADEDDLSSKPRCQRCRKSKKGCDRQRPCQRCKDAGIGPDGCVSEDEGNGRKGRYGRHMGVPLSKDSIDTLDTLEQSVVSPDTAVYLSDAAHIDASKKRKR